jgi:sec-independent protein translocase protein TatA
MFEPSWEKLLIVLVIALIVLGPKKLPEVGRNLGHGIREFKDGISGNAKDEPAQTPTPPAATIDPPATYSAPTTEQSAVHHTGE